ncbi:pre-mRNA-splicing factor SLU7-A-like [Arachis ipaensis]|uniref:pre-mRNA-splicing factor SLU7-A-like n=1 Tax=Arachis ipaensis TaxID=130454 RepID=UPI000A2B6650|nr:pre-mRNA-splicing factor SLU7-A-like [Arachis ipaensis]
MATASVAFKSREDHRKQIELEEARKAGLAPAEVDEDGKEINPHIPQYMSSAPWYLNAERPSLKHQRKWKSDPNYTKSWYDRGAKIFQADKYRKGACENCGAMTHDAKSCMERPRRVAFVLRQHFLEASMRRMFTLTTTLLFGAHGGGTTNGAISAASRPYVIAIALVLLV